jgi:spore germination cell wall hydrolase CwlJ-like protein
VLGKTLGVLALAATAVLAAPMPAAALSGREFRCLAMIAYAEAAMDGLPGMAAVMRVVRNRVADPRFPDDACAVIAQTGQFQPVTESPVLRRVARDPEGYSIPQVLGVRSSQARRLLAEAHRLAGAPLPARDPTGGALYFVNPELMDPARCPWFAALKRTARIGAHLFMTHYRPGERRGPPALDCKQAGSRRVAAARAP